MIDLLQTEKAFISPHIKKDGVAVDFTMGNGHDTLWLAQQIGENGRVYAFDIQTQALESTKALLDENGITNATLILDSHANIKEYVKEQICVGMFNLGFLPGGDKSITTKHESSLAAIKAGIELLCDDGALLIAVYPGHEEGTIEGNMIREMLKDYDRRKICCSEFHIVNSPSSPFFYLVEKK
ncbi:MAG: methyltransferase domain-containing protein [Clostridia bacterium]|nr:methyltransferase domain-containing protein [Clostridia bacterium]